MSAKAQPVYFPYNPDKATQAILFLLKAHDGKIDKLKLVKELYLADKQHLLRYGRPIVGGEYFAMPHGPVSSPLLKHLNQATTGLYPFCLEGKTVKSDISEFETDELSQSDIEVLEFIDRRYGHLHSWGLRNLTHLLWEYSFNWSKRKEGSRRHPISYEDLFKHVKDKSMLDIIREDQEVRSIF